MSRKREQGVSKREYGSHVCQAQATQDGSKLTGKWLCITFTMVRSFVSLTKDGNRCRVFYAIGWRTLPQKNFFTFFLVYVMEGPYSLFLFSFYCCVCSRIFTAARLRLPFSSFSLFPLIFIATFLGIDTVLCSCGNN